MFNFSMTNIARFTARVHPSGRLTVGYVPSQKIKAADLSYESILESYSEPDCGMNEIPVQRLRESKEFPDFQKITLFDVHEYNKAFTQSDKWIKTPWLDRGHEIIPIPGTEFQLEGHHLQKLGINKVEFTDSQKEKLKIKKNDTELGSSEASNFYQPKKVPQKKGLVGITAYARLKVENAAAILEKKYGKSGLAMTTFTVPPLSEQGSEIFHQSYSEYVKFLVRNLTKVFEANGMQSEFVYVNELQEKRYASYQERKKQGSMEVPPTIQHIHILHPRFRPEFIFDESDQVKSTINFDVDDDGRRRFLDRDTKELLLSSTRYLFTSDYLRKLNQRAINFITGETVSTAASIDISVVRKSAIAYLGKYLSKGEKICSQIVKEGNERILPKHWSGVTKFLHDQIKEATRVIKGGAAEAAMTYAEFLKEEGYFESYHYSQRLETSREVLQRVSGVRDYDTNRDTLAFVELGDPRKVQCGLSATLTSKVLNDVTEFIELLEALSRTPSSPPPISRSFGGGAVLSDSRTEYELALRDSKLYRKLADKPVKAVNKIALKNLAQTFQST